MNVCSVQFSHVQLYMTPWTVARQAPLSMEFSRQEYWSELPFHSPAIFPTQESNPGLLDCKQILYYLSHTGSKQIFPLFQREILSLSSKVVCCTNILENSLGQKLSMLLLRRHAKHNRPMKNCLPTNLFF